MHSSICSSLLCHRCSSRQIFWGAKDICPNFPKLARKVFVRLLPTNFLSERPWRPFLMWPPIKGLYLFFCKRWKPFFEVKQRLAPFFHGFCPDFQGYCPDFWRFCPDFYGFCPDFRPIKTYGVVLAPRLLHHCFMHSWVCPKSDHDSVLKLKTLRVHAPEPSTACTSGQCDQTRRKWGTSGYATFGIIKRLWQTRAFENKVQLWPVSCCVIKRILCR